MALSNRFREYVASGNVTGIRIMMKDSLLVDPTFTEFQEMADYAHSMPGLYDIHDGSLFQTDKSTWNDDYMNKLMVEVVGNFSKERLVHLMEVVGLLHPAPVRPSQPHNPPCPGGTGHGNRKPRTPYETQKDEDLRNGRVVKIVGGTAAGAVAGGAIAAIAGASVGGVAGAAVVGAAVVGAAVAANTKERD